MSQVMIITGGGRGIGASTALLAAEKGFSVAVCYERNAQTAERVAADVQMRGQNALAVRADVSQEQDVLRLFEVASERLGRVDVLVNSAGIVDAQSRVEAMSAQRMARMLAVNVLGTMLCAREAVKRMSTRNGGQGGAIINVSSRAARGGSPGEYVDYAASKGAVDTFTIGLAKEVATEGIRVNAVRPGIIDTEIHASGGQPDRAQRMASAIPIGRAGTPEEVARAILWLASSEASYCTGVLLDVSGGR